MPGASTPILGLTVPTVGADANVWGGELNFDLAILDNLGAMLVTTLTTSSTLGPSTFPEQYVRCICGLNPLIVGLPVPSLMNAGKAFLVKKIDSGPGVLTIVSAAGIDGQTSWIRAAQWSFLRVLSIGTAYEIIGGN